MYFNKIKPIHFCTTTLLCVVLFLFSIPVFAQVTCGGQTINSACLHNSSQTFQCISGNANASSLFGAQLLNPTAALTTPQFLIVSGKITFDNDYTFATGSEVVFLDNNSGFKVSGNKKLTLKSSSFHGCEKLWAGIEVLNAGKITAENCTFEDAKAAIILRNQSVIIATGNTFKKNACGILGMSANPAVTISILPGSKAGISSNTFWGDDPLLESIVPSSIDAGINSDASSASTGYPYNGIWIERVTALTVGFSSNLRVITPNIFRDFGQHQELNVRTQGIRSIQSNITIMNSRFLSFGLYDPLNTGNNISSDGVFARNDGAAITQTRFIGTNQNYLVVPANTFSNCWQDIRTFGTDLFVTEMTSKKAGNSILSQMGTSEQGSIVVEILNNRIHYFRSIGVEIGFFKPILINVEGNEIFDNDELYDPASRYGIIIKSSVSSELSLAGSRIYKNEIRSRSQLLGGAFWGIALRKVADLGMELNQILEEEAVSNLGAFYGIRTQQSPCTGLKIYSNTITGAKIDYTSSIGIYVNESVDCVLNCNEMDLTNIGMLFTGMCNSADVSRNKFHFHDVGFSLGSGTFSGSSLNQIGLQTAKENQWFGTNSNIEAFALNTASALSSIFEINSSNLSSDFWPLPRKIGTADDIFTWFIQLPGQEPSSNPTCLTDEKPKKEKLSDEEEHLVDNTYETPFDYPAMVWEAKWKFADQLYQHPSLQTIDANTEQYYQNTANESYTRMSNIYRDYLNRWRPDDEIARSMNNANEALRTAIALRFAMEEDLSEEDDDITRLHEQMLERDASIEIAVTDITAVFDQFKALVDQNVSTLYAELGQIACSEIFEVDMQSVLNTMLLSHLAGEVLTQQQIDAMQAIADKCRYSSGYAVVLARGFFEPLDSYEQDKEECLMERSTVKKQTNTHKIDLFPNPASQTISLQIDRPFKSGTIQLFNSQGLVVRTLNIQNQNTSVSISDLVNGMYFVEIRLDENPGIHQSFVKVR